MASAVAQRIILMTIAPVIVEAGPVPHSRPSNSSTQSPGAEWLTENGPRELELLFRAIVYHPSNPIFITDDEGNSRDASIGVGDGLGRFFRHSFRFIDLMRGALTDFRRLASFLRCTVSALIEVEECHRSAWVLLRVPYVLRGQANCFAARDGAGR